MSNLIQTFVEFKLYNITTSVQYCNSVIDLRRWRRRWCRRIQLCYDITAKGTQNNGFPTDIYIYNIYCISSSSI